MYSCYVSAQSADEDEDDEETMEPEYEEYEEDVETEHSRYGLRTKNEIVELKIEKPNFEIKPDTTLIPVGTIKDVVDNVIVVESQQTGSSTVLDMGTSTLR